MRIFLAIVAVMALVLVSLGTAVVTDEASAGASVTVNEFIDITIIDTTPAGFSFGSLNPGTKDNKETAQVDGAVSTTPAVTVKNELTSNVNAGIRLKGTDFIGPGASTIAVTNVDYDDDGVVNQPIIPVPETQRAQTGMTTSYPVAAYITLGPGFGGLPIWFWLDVPQIGPGTYSSTFSFQGTSA